MTDSNDPAVRKFRPRRDAAVPLQTLLDQELQSDTGGEEAAAKTAQMTEDGKVPEIGGRRGGLDPTRYGDWEKGGRCIDF